MVSLRKIMFLTALAAGIAASAADTADGHALVRVAAACLRGEPSNSSELETQATYGTPLQIIVREEEWLRAVTPDGYEAWINESAVTECDSAAMARWRHSPRLIVTAPQPLTAYSDTVSQSPRTAVADVTLNAIFEGEKTPGANFARITIADGRTAYLPAWALADFGEWSRRPADTSTVLENAYACMGATYLWGGTTLKALDCSGLTSCIYFSAGLILPRNASAQALCGQPLDVSEPEKFRQGDLLFFDDGSGSGRVTHVAVYDGDGRYVHSSGRVFTASFDPRDELYIPRRVVKAARVIGDPDCCGRGVIPVAQHPWYF